MRIQILTMAAVCAAGCCSARPATEQYVDVEIALATNAVTSRLGGEISAATNGLETAAHAVSTYQPKGDYLTEESDPTVDAKILTATNETLAAAKDYTDGCATDLVERIAGKQDEITDLTTIRSGAALGATALQTETDPTVPSWAKATSRPSYTWAEIEAKPTAFTPSAHIHAQNDIDGLAASLTNKVGADSFVAPLKHEAALPVMQGFASIVRPKEDEYSNVPLSSFTNAPTSRFRFTGSVYYLDEETYDSPVLWFSDRDNKAYGYFSTPDMVGWYRIVDWMPTEEVDISTIVLDPSEVMISFNYMYPTPDFIHAGLNWEALAVPERTTILTDSAPTAGSGNLLTSGAVKTAFDSVRTETAGQISAALDELVKDTPGGVVYKLTSEGGHFYFMPQVKED